MNVQTVNDTTEKTALAEQRFLPIELGTMQPGTKAPVDLYLRQKNTARHVLYKTAETPLCDEIRERLLLNGVQTVYMREEDEQAFQAYVEEQIDAIIGDEMTPIDRAWPLVYQTASRVMQSVFEDPRSGNNLSRASRVVGSIVQSVIKSPTPLRSVTELIAYDYHTYTHCVNVSVFMLAAANELLGVRSPNVLREIGEGAILHDVGKTQIPKEILNKPGKLTREEYEKVKEHPALGVDLVQHRVPLSRISHGIIRNHHEHWDGGGYPDGLEGDQIPVIAQLATVIDVYDALTTKRSYQDAHPPYNALRLMVNMKGLFNAEFVRAFVVLLGPEDDSRDARARSQLVHTTFFAD